MLNFSAYGSLVTFTFHLHGWIYSEKLEMGYIPSASTYSMLSLASKSTTLSICLSFFYAWVVVCSLGDSHIAISHFFLCLIIFQVSCTCVGFSLGDLGTVGIGVGTSMLTTFGAAPLEEIVPLVFAVSPSLDIVL